MYVYKRVDISMMVMCNASVSGIDTIAYDRRTKELSNAALHMKQDVDSIEKKTIKPQT
jgi:hypothetical protein